MNVLIAIFFAVLGAVVGSFLGVIVTRLNTGMTIGGRSRCFSCRTTLRWFELIPVASFIAQRGRCRSCQSVIPSRDFMIELVTALAFLGVGMRFAAEAVYQPFFWLSVLVLLIIASLLIVISFYDLKHTIVPDKIVFPLIGIAFVSIFLVQPAVSFLVQPAFMVPSLWHGLAGILIPLPFFLIWLLSKGRLMGFGDIKLMVAIGWLLGMSFGISAVIIAFWIGALFSIGVIALQRLPRLFRVGKQFIIGSEIPFAPFLALGWYIVLIFDVNLLALPFM
jgi:leader peptidase (prepilin peptidase)/N-methyltransferase